MKNNKTLEPVTLDIDIDNIEDLMEVLPDVLKSLEFRNLVKSQILHIVVDAVENGKDKVSIIRFINHNIEYILHKTQYRNLLNTVLTMFKEEEDYLKCKEVKLILDKVQ